MSWKLCNYLSLPLSSCATFETISHVPLTLQHQCYSISGPCPCNLLKALFGYALSKGTIRDNLKSNHLHDKSIKVGFIRVLGRLLWATRFALLVHETSLTLVKLWIWSLNIHCCLFTFGLNTWESTLILVLSISLVILIIQFEYHMSWFTESYI